MRLKIVKRLFPLAVAAGALTTACYYDKLPEAEPNTCEEEVSYAMDVQPILTSKCATVGCHDGRTDPKLTSDVSYDNLVNGGFVDTDDPEQSFLYKVLTVPQIIMPPSGALPQREIDDILCWIEQGAPDN
jgi:hypothetical protein